MAGKTENQEWKKKCAMTGATLRKVKRYYRDGKYFKNKTAFKDFAKKQKEDAAAAAAAPSAETK